MKKDKANYIGNYLNKKMKGNTMPYGMEYLSLIAELEDKAEKNWKRKQKKINNARTNKYKSLSSRRTTDTT